MMDTGQNQDQSYEIVVPPCWKILRKFSPREAEGIRVIIRPGSGFGNGTHETTQLCLQAISAFAPRGRRAWRMLDFGSGSGILAIGAAKLGVTVAAIEIDKLSLEEARENARINSVADRIFFSQTLDGVAGPFDLIVANILRSVLLESARGLTSRLALGGVLVLSGLVSTDVPEVVVRYASLLDGRRPRVHSRGEWRALSWLPKPGNVCSMT